MPAYNGSELSQSELDTYLGPKPKAKRSVGLEDILRSEPAVTNIVDELRSSTEANRGHQTFVPEFTDKDYLATRQTRVAGTGGIYEVTERPIYIEPTQDPAESYSSAYATGALKIARKNIPPSGASLEDQARVLTETLAVGDEQVANAIAERRAPLIQQITKATQEVTKLAQESSMFTSGEIGKQKRLALDAKTNEVIALKQQLEFLDIQLKDDKGLVGYQSDRVRIAAQLEDVKKRLEDERQIAQAKAQAENAAQTRLDFAPAMEAVKQKSLASRAKLKKEAASLPDEAKATLGQLAKLQEERVAIKNGNMPEEAKVTQLQEINQRINEQRSAYAQQLANLPAELAQRGHDIAIRQEKLIGYDETGLDAQYAAKAKADETRMRLAQQIRKETFTEEQAAKAAEYDRQFKKVQEAQGTAREKQAEIEFASWERKFYTRQIAEEADKIDFNKEWDRRQAVLEAAKDENAREAAQRSLDQLRERAGLGSQEWDRRYAKMRADKGTDRELDSTAKFNLWQKQEAERKLTKAEDRKAFNAEWDRRQKVLDTAADENARDAAQRQLTALAASALLKQAAIPAQAAAELDLYARKIEVAQRAKLTGAGEEQHQRDLADMRARIAEQAKLLPIKQQAAVDMYLRKLEDTKDMEIFRAEVDQAYADTPEDIQLKAMARRTGTELAAEEQYNARVGTGAVADQKRKMIEQASGGRSYGQMYAQNKQEAEAYLAAASYFAENGTEPTAMNTIGLDPDKQAFAAGVMKAQQTTTAGKGYMDSYTRLMAAVKDDPDALKNIAPAPVNGRVPEKAPARWKQLFEAEATATTAAQKNQIEAEKQQYIAVELERRQGDVAVNNAINRTTLGFAGSVYRNEEHASFIESQIIGTLSGKSPEEKQAYADMLATLRYEAWTSYGDLVKKLTDAAQYQAEGYGKLIDLPSANKTVIPKERAAEMAGELLNRVLPQIDARTENTLSRSGYTPKVWEVNIKQAVSAVQAISWAERLGLVGTIFKPVTPYDLEQQLNQVQ